MKLQFVSEQLSSKLKTRKGFTLIEVMFSVAIFSVLFLSVLSFQLNNIRLRKRNDDLRQLREYVEIVQNRMFYNSNYASLLNVKDSNRHYINSDKMTLNKLKTDSLENLLTAPIPGSKPYIYINITGSDVLRVEIQLFCRISEREELLSCEFFKGNYSP